MAEIIERTFATVSLWLKLARRCARDSIPGAQASPHRGQGNASIAFGPASKAFFSTNLCVHRELAPALSDKRIRSGKAVSILGAILVVQVFGLTGQLNDLGLAPPSASFSSDLRRPFRQLSRASYDFVALSRATLGNDFTPLTMSSSPSASVERGLTQCRLWPSLIS